MKQLDFSVSTTPKTILDTLSSYVFPSKDTLHPALKQMMEDFLVEFEDLMREIRAAILSRPLMPGSSNLMMTDELKIKIIQASHLYRLAYLVSLCGSHIIKKTENPLGNVFYFSVLITSLKILEETLIDNININASYYHAAVFLSHLVRLINEIRFDFSNSNADNSFFIDPIFLKSLIKELLQFILLKLDAGKKRVTVEHVLEKFNVEVPEFVTKKNKEAIRFLFTDDDVGLKVRPLHSIKLAPRPLSWGLTNSFGSNLLSVPLVSPPVRCTRTPPPPSSSRLLVLEG